jgi:hypothetical protein
MVLRSACTSRGSNPDHRCLRPVLSPIKVLVPGRLWGHRNFRATVGKDDPRRASALGAKPLQSRRFGDPEKRNSKLGNTARTEPSRAVVNCRALLSAARPPLPAGNVNACAGVGLGVAHFSLDGDRPAPCRCGPGGRAHAQRDEQGKDPKPARNSDPQKGHRGALPHAISTKTSVAPRADGTALDGRSDVVVSAGRVRQTLFDRVDRARSGAHVLGGRADQLGLALLLEDVR